MRRNPYPDRVERRLAPEPWRGQARWNLHPRLRGSGETVSVSEPMGGRARRNLRPRPRGSGETVSASEAHGVGRVAVWPGGSGVRRSGARALVIVDDLFCPLRFLSL